jgi:cobalamin biosynthetic protein CobC
LDRAWAKAMRDTLAREAARLDHMLTAAKLAIIGGTSLFRLVQTPAAEVLFDHFGRAGILVRRFAEQPTWLRFGLPGDEAAWQRLAVALAGFVEDRDGRRRSEPLHLSPPPLAGEGQGGSC